jgi:hypothetical protein
MLGTVKIKARINTFPEAFFVIEVVNFHNGTSMLSALPLQVVYGKICTKEARFDDKYSEN